LTARLYSPTFTCKGQRIRFSQPIANLAAGRKHLYQIKGVVKTVLFPFCVTTRISHLAIRSLFVQTLWTSCFWFDGA